MSGFTGLNKPLLNAVAALASGICTAGKGVPELPETQLYATVTLGGALLNRRATGGAWGRSQRILVEFSYRVPEDEGLAEDALADAVDAFTDAVLADPTLGGITHDVELDTSLADSPDYARWSGQERRLYPVQLTFRQSAQIPLP